MKHITNITIEKNKIIVSEPIEYTVGDANVPYIRLKFNYLFEEESLKNKNLEIRYIFSDEEFITNNILIENNNDILFKVNPLILTKEGFVTVQITLQDEMSRFTLDDFVIKIKKLKGANEYMSEAINKIISNYGKEKANEILTLIKEEISQYVENKREELKGNQGEDGAKGAGITDIVDNNNGSITINYDDDKTVTIQVPTIKGDKGEQGIQGEMPIITIGENGNWYINGEDTGKTTIADLNGGINNYNIIQDVLGWRYDIKYEPEKFDIVPASFNSTTFGDVRFNIYINKKNKDIYTDLPVKVGRELYHDKEIIILEEGLEILENYGENLIFIGLFKALTPYQHWYKTNNILKCFDLTGLHYSNEFYVIIIETVKLFTKRELEEINDFTKSE